MILIHFLLRLFYGYVYWLWLYYRTIGWDGNNTPGVLMLLLPNFCRVCTYEQRENKI